MDGASAAAVRAAATPPADPGQIRIRQRFIDNLGRLLLSLQSGRVIPRPAVDSLQLALVGIRSQLHAPNREASLQFQRYVRLMVSDPSIDPEHLAGMSRAFNQVLVSMGASATQRAAFAPGLTQLIQVNSTGSNPSELTANDFGLLFQALQMVGKPLAPPVRPQLDSTDDTGAKGDRTTAIRRPHFVGTFAEGFIIQLLDNQRNVIGQTTTDAQGRYRVQPNLPFALGRVSVRVRAIDASAGDVSGISAPTTIKVIAPPTPRTRAVPRGPVR
jgi:hypothetical protein